MKGVLATSIGDWRYLIDKVATPQSDELQSVKIVGTEDCFKIHKKKTLTPTSAEEVDKLNVVIPI